MTERAGTPTTGVLQPGEERGRANGEIRRVKMDSPVLPPNQKTKLPGVGWSNRDQLNGEA